MYYDYFCWLSINKGFAVKQGLSCMGNTIIVMAKMGGLLYQQKIAILVKIWLRERLFDGNNTVIVNS